MEQLKITLFGKLCIRYGDELVEGCEACKVQELFCYLLLNRNRPHAREMLASLLWGNHCTTAQSKKYLRKALWQLQATLNRSPGLADSGLLLAESDWIQLRPIPDLWLDVAVFEAAYAAVKGVSGRTLEDRDAHVLERVVRLYTGYLLENWYQDWCLCERERLHQIYLIMLDKLAAYCETHRAYEMGLSYGNQILQYDRARERTHQQMMRLHYLAGDRSSALHQYRRCVAALKEELDVEPSRNTVALYEQIRQDRLLEPAASSVQETTRPAADDVAACLRQIQAGLAHLQLQVQRAIQAIELGPESWRPTADKPDEWAEVNAQA